MIRLQESSFCCGFRAGSQGTEEQATRQSGVQKEVHDDPARLYEYNLALRLCRSGGLCDHRVARRVNPMRIVGINA